MIRTRGRPFGSKDQHPREKRTKIQCCVDRYTGQGHSGKKHMEATVQHPCEKCGSCVRVQFTYKRDTSPDPPEFLTRALSECFKSGVSKISL